MKIILDNDELYVPDDMMTEYLHKKLTSGLGKRIKLGKHGVIDLTRKSVLSVLIRQAIVMFFMPLFLWIADGLHMNLPEKEKHGDSILWCINAYCSILDKACSEAEITFETTPYIDGIKKISYVSLDTNIKNLLES